MNQKSPGKHLYDSFIQYIIDLPDNPVYSPKTFPTDYLFQKLHDDYKEVKSIKIKDKRHLAAYEWFLVFNAITIQRIDAILLTNNPDEILAMKGDEIVTRFFRVRTALFAPYNL